MTNEIPSVAATPLNEAQQDHENPRQFNQQLEERIRRRTAELEAVLNTAPVGLAIAEDPEGRHIRGNPALEQMLGLRPGEELSSGAREPARYRVLRDGCELPAEQLPMQRAIRGEHVSGEEIDIQRPDGQTRTLYSTAVPLLDEQGRPRGAVGAFLRHHADPASRAGSLPGDSAARGAYAGAAGGRELF